MTGQADLAAGARNLLIACAELKSGDDLLIVHEDPDLGWYDLVAPMAVAAEARNLGINSRLLQTGGPDDGRRSDVAEAIAAHDRVLFFARIGDQDRFADPVPGKTTVMSYVRDAAMLASAYGTTDHRALVALKQAVNSILLGAGDIRITCPLGTEISGTLSEQARRAAADVSVRRFPLGVPQPIDASGFSGRVALGRYLTPTGSKAYEPAFLEMDSPVFANVAAGRITRFSGEADAVAGVRCHYDHVAGLFGIDAEAVHSWHAGLHPGCVHPIDAAENPDRWSNTVFTHPRFLHFHTCGAYAPGEICWMVLDHTVTVDGVPLWLDGRLCVDAFAATRRCLENWPELRLLFAGPMGEIGLSEPVTVARARTSLV